MTLAVLRQFFRDIDTGALFQPVDPAALRQRRETVREAFFNLLLHHRPFLEATVGLDWPYAQMAQRVERLNQSAEQGATPDIRREARLFLALLPFPAQWNRLLQVEHEMGNHPEIRELIQTEQEKIAAKVKKKSQKKFKLRHFCQVLKRPRLPEEKGILRIFSLPYLFADPRLLRELSRKYLLYVEPPWGVLARHTWLRAFSLLEDPCILGVGGAEDAAFLETQPGIRITRLAHGDFLEDDVDILPEPPKTVEIAFNATYDDIPRKRHGFVLELLNHPRLQNVTALFLGRGEPGHVETCREMVRTHGLTDRVTVLDNLMRKDVPEQLARCRTGLQVSLHENACRSIYEYFRSDLPCVVSSAMAGFNFDLITRQNGIIASDAEMPDAIQTVLNHPEQFSPRHWFLNQSGSERSSHLLNELFRDVFREQGYRWREDIVPLGSSGANRYVDETDYLRFRPEFEELLEILRRFLPVRLSLE